MAKKKLSRFTVKLIEKGEPDRVAAFYVTWTKKRSGRIHEILTDNRGAIPLTFSRAVPTWP